LPSSSFCSAPDNSSWPERISSVENALARVAPDQDAVRAELRKRGASLALFLPACAGVYSAATDRWLLMFYRDKANVVAKNMTRKNSEFTRQLAKNLRAALDDLTASKPGDPQFELF
jgi:hypothetical protein